MRRESFCAGTLTLTLFLTTAASALAGTPAHLWSRGFGGTNGAGGHSVAVDGSGNVIMTGYFSGTVNFGGADLTSAGATEIFLAKFSANGVHQWSQRFGSTSHDQGNSVAVDGSGAVIVTGTFAGTVNFGGSNLTSAGD